MTDRELFEKALEAIDHLYRTGDTQVFDLCYAPELIPALRERLAQPKIKWRGLTAKERTELWWSMDSSGMPEHTYGKAIEAKLKEKNT